MYSNADKNKFSLLHILPLSLLYILAYFTGSPVQCPSHRLNAHISVDLIYVVANNTNLAICNFFHKRKLRFNDYKLVIFKSIVIIHLNVHLAEHIPLKKR